MKPETAAKRMLRYALEFARLCDEVSELRERMWRSPCECSDWVDCWGRSREDAATVPLDDLDDETWCGACRTRRQLFLEIRKTRRKRSEIARNMRRCRRHIETEEVA